MAHYTNESFVRTKSGSAIQIGELSHECDRTRLFEYVAENNDTYGDSATGKTWRLRNGTLERYRPVTTVEEKSEPRPTEEEIIQKTAEHILAKVKEMVKIPLMPQGMPEQIWSRSMEEAARILTTCFNMSDQTREGFLNTVKKDPRWRSHEQKDFDTSAVRAKAEERRQEQADSADIGPYARRENQPGTWTRIDTLAYKGEMEGMRNKAWTEGVEHAIAILKENGYDTAAFQLGSQTIRHWRWKK